MTVALSSVADVSGSLPMAQLARTRTSSVAAAFILPRGEGCGSLENDDVADPVSAMGDEPLLAYVAQGDGDRRARPDLAADGVEERRRIGVGDRRRGRDDGAGPGEHEGRRQAP